MIYMLYFQTGWLARSPNINRRVRIRRLKTGGFYDYETHRFTTERAYKISKTLRQRFKLLEEYAKFYGWDIHYVKDLFKGDDTKAVRKIVEELRKKKKVEELRKRKKLIIKLGEIMDVEYGVVVTNREIEEYIKGRLQEIEISSGYFYKIIIEQEHKPTAVKEMYLYHSHVGKKLRNSAGKFYNIERTYWITVNAIQRMKSFWGLHSGWATIEIKKI